MTVAELIEALKKMPQTAEVFKQFQVETLSHAFTEQEEIEECRFVVKDTHGNPTRRVVLL